MGFRMLHADLDAAILACVTGRWQKVAMIIALTIEQRGGEFTDKNGRKVAKRIEALVRMRKLEAQGDLSFWRYSEVRLPEDDGR